MHFDRGGDDGGAGGVSLFIFFLISRKNQENRAEYIQEYEVQSIKCLHICFVPYFGYLFDRDGYDT